MHWFKITVIERPIQVCYHWCMKFEFQYASKMTKLILIGEFLLVSYLLYALTSYIYRNYQVDYHIKNFQALNDKIASDNKKAAEDLLYYTSGEYIEKVAKQNLGLVNPGEEVVIISDDLLNQPVNDTIEASNSADRISKYYNISNPRKWWKFFFEIDHRPNASMAPSPTIIQVDQPTGKQPSTSK